jgi:hypothetical protein
MKKSLLVVLLISKVVYPSEGSPFAVLASSVYMPKNHWPDREMTLQQALNQVEINALSWFRVDFESQTVHVEELVYRGFLNAFTAYSSSLGAVKEPSSFKLITEFGEGCKAALKNRKGYTGDRLAAVRKNLLTFEAMGQDHFNWIQNNKGDADIVTELAERIHRCYEDDSRVSDLFLYLDEQVKATSVEVLEQWRNPSLSFQKKQF